MADIDMIEEQVSGRCTGRARSCTPRYQAHGRNGAEGGQARAQRGGKTPSRMGARRLLRQVSLSASHR
jgi:hypothetical protein